MTKSEFEEVLRDQGYEKDNRLHDTYWSKEFYPTYIVGRSRVVKLGDEYTAWYDLESEKIGITGDNG